MPKQTKRGSGITVTLPTEPIAGVAKNTPIMAVMVADDGVPILEYELPLGQSITFRVGGTIRAFMERVGPAPDSAVWLTCQRQQPRPHHGGIRARLGGSTDSYHWRRPAVDNQPSRLSAVGDERTELGVENG